MGQGQEILINVVDERPRSTLGTRGVRGVGSEISVEGDLCIPIYNSVADGLVKSLQGSHSRERGSLPPRRD